MPFFSLSFISESEPEEGEDRGWTLRQIRTLLGLKGSRANEWLRARMEEGAMECSGRIVPPYALGLGGTAPYYRMVKKEG